MTELFDHARKIVDEDKERTGLFLGTGATKTRIALCLARGSTLAIVPKTQRDDKNWPREIIKAKLKVNLTVISKEDFRRDHASLPAFKTVIVDEAHTCLGVTPNTRQRKGKQIPKTSQLFEALESYIERTKPKRLYLCTATIMRSPMTVWGAAKILGRDIDFRTFRDEYYVRLPMPFREVYAPRNDAGVKNSLAKLVRSLGYVGRLEDFFDVPEQVWKTEFIDLTTKQKQRISQLQIDYPDPIACIQKKHGVENGVLSGNEFSAAEIFPNGKIEKILDYAIEFPRMVVFAKYRAQIEQIAAALKKAGHKVAVLTGDTKDRGKLLADAAKAKECIFIAQSQISAGWELKEYPVMIFASRNYEWVHFEQAKGRIQRADRIKKNLYIKLITRYKGSIDEAVDHSLENKQDFNERIYATRG